MDTVLTRTGDAPVLEAPKGGTRGATRMLGRLLLAMAQTAGERVILPQRDVPPEWFRFPLP
jgi:hypothetical protein